ncbi:MAG: hypothetical protein HY720_19235 [Planctomycetes bacterium]|nr:hypothetical protein [Planctomycetota bacterium]
MRVSYATLALGLLGLTGLFSSPAGAQEETRNPLDEIAPPAGPDGAAPEESLGLAATPPAPAGVTPRQTAEEIDRNFDKALDNYDDIIGSEKTAAVRNLEDRIAQNEKLLEKNQTELGRYRGAVRQIKIEYTRQLLNLKTSFRGGRIDEKTYEKKAKQLADEYVFKVKEVEKDIGFYKTESDATAARINTMQAEARFQRVAAGKDRAASKKKDEPNALESLVMELGAAHQLHLQDVWDEGDCRFCRVR